MMDRTLFIAYREYESVNELPSQDRLLVEEAIKAMDESYAPYSRFNVGAAVSMSNGVIVTGSNQENAAFPSGMCAERTALFYATSHYPSESVRSIAIVARDQTGTICRRPVTPCGACRQVMAEVRKRAGQKISVILVGSESIYVFDDIEALLPFIFDSI